MRGSNRSIRGRGYVRNACLGDSPFNRWIVALSVLLAAPREYGTFVDRNTVNAYQWLHSGRQKWAAF
ncbi:hypothetical protein HYPGJ_10564 [Hyphomicrobium sp. GJ21]|nr:hypothetical protein HYPGJ_10564 [Hyphomicrobium sp. GJ21]